MAPTATIKRRCARDNAARNAARPSSGSTTARSASSGARMRRLVLPFVFVFLFDVTAASAAPCASADPVRFLLNGVEYRVPVALQPFYSPVEALTTEDYFPKGGSRTRRYCQSPQDAPAVVDRISFPNKPLTSWAREDATRAELAGIFPLVIERSVRPRPPISDDGLTTAGGLFRRIDRRWGFEIVSVEPLLFGAKITADCGPAGTQQPSNRCAIRGRLRDQSHVSLGVLDAEKPLETWPRMLRQVEVFISSLTTEAK